MSARTCLRVARLGALVASLLAVALDVARAEDPKEAPKPTAEATGPGGGTPEGAAKEGDKEPAEGGLLFVPRIPITDPRTREACLDRKVTTECKFDGLVGTCQPFDCVWEGEPDPDAPPGSKTVYPCVRCAVPPEGWVPPDKKKGGGDAAKAEGSGDAAPAQGDAAKPADVAGETPPPPAEDAKAEVAPPPQERCAPAAGAAPAPAPAPVEEGGCMSGGVGPLGGALLSLLLVVRRRRDD